MVLPASDMVPTVMVLSVTPRLVAPCAVPGPHTPFKVPKSPAAALVRAGDVDWEPVPTAVWPAPDRVQALPAIRMPTTATAAHPFVARLGRLRQIDAPFSRTPSSVSELRLSRVAL